jgi:DNA-binding MarR family transcriptional regulator
VTTPAGRVWGVMRELVLDHDRRDEVGAELGMSFFRVKVLRHVAAEPATMGVLAESLRSDAPYVSVVVDDLVRRGLVVRAADPGDRRRKIVSVTAEGARAAARAGELLAVPPAALAALPADDLAALERLLAGLGPENVGGRD